MPANTRIYGEHDEKTIRQLDRCMEAGSAFKGVLCADGHLGYAHPIGGVVAYEEHISISGVGFDIACGNMAVRLDTRYEDIAAETGRILSDIGRSISFGIGQRNAVKVDHELFDSPLWDEAGARDLKTMAQQQLGTVGSGNHYVDLFEDEEGFVWIGVHFGSRGLGHKITTRQLALVGAKDGMEVEPALVHQDSEVGQSYLAGVKLGGLYAYAGREWVVERVRRIIGGHITDSVHNHHNFVWRESHEGRDYWVVRKGATPAFPGQRGFVKKNKAGQWTRPPRFTRDEMDAWLRDKGILLRGGDVDESPMVYRRLEEVLAYHQGTIEIEHTLRPFAVAMAGPGEFDPYKD
ncbi:MAG: hypothetical protein K0R61_2384 [Microvirga sp.]|nr:hypothetical protein [Microvirga sp.]